MPLVIDAGEMPATAALAGLMKSISSRSRSASTSALRTRMSAFGELARMISFDSTEMVAPFSGSSDMRLTSNRVSGLA